MVRERLMETQEHDEHIGKTNQKGNQNFIKKHLSFPYSRFPFKGEEDRSLRLKRRVAKGSGSCCGFFIFS